MSDAFMAGVRERLGMTDADVSEDAVLAVLSERLTDQPKSTVPEGTVLIDAGVLAEIRADGVAGREALSAMNSARRTGIVNDAVKQGRISNANRDTWLASLERDEAGAVALLATVEANTHPVVETGHQVERSVDDVSYDTAWPDDKHDEHEEEA